MALLGKTAILAAEDVDYEDVPVPEWGGEVRVVGLSGYDRDAYETAMAAATKGDVAAAARLLNFRSKLVVKAIVNDKFERVFADSDAKDLGAKNGKVINKLFDTIRRLSGMGKEAVEEGKAPSETAQNSPSNTD